MSSSRKHTYVLGIGLSHDASACLLRDGRVEVAIEKERLTRRKHDGGNDSETILYCLDAAGISYDDLSLVVQNQNYGMFEQGNGWRRGPRVLTDAVPVVTISHHLAHAYSAIGACPFDDAAVLVIDGCGNRLTEAMDLQGTTIPISPPQEVRHLYFEKDSYYRFNRGSLRTIYKDFSPYGLELNEWPMYPPSTLHSIGGVYSGASMYAFGGFDDPGKLMGLAPYGRPGVHDFEIFDLRDGRVFVRYDWMESFRRPATDYADFRANFQYYADLAYWIQREVERAILYVIQARYALEPAANLAYAGGVALNAVANRRILLETNFENVFIQPAAGDNGLALGCAYYGWLDVLKRERIRSDGASTFGRVYSKPQLEAPLTEHAGRVIVQESTSTADIVERSAALLAGGKVIGWFQGKSEFGPRALGHRSILADPRNPDVRDFINAKIKFREDFRPFAPSVAREDVDRYFDCPYQSPYMILVAPVRSEWRDVIPSVVHRDGSARIQTVTRESDSTYHALLKAFEKITGLAVLLNTSFNRRGMPIVETPREAIEFFLASALDALVLGPFLVQKAPAGAMQPSARQIIEEDLRASLSKHRVTARDLGGVYALRIHGSQTWTLNFYEGKVIAGNVGNSDATVELEDDEFVRLFGCHDPGELEREVQGLLREGHMTLSGSAEAASRLLQFLKLR